MKIEIYKWNIEGNKWFARATDGPWYSDSEPVSQGFDTPEEAVSDLITLLKEIHTDLGVLIANPKVERGVDQH